MSHYIEKCPECDTVLGQCRCPGPKETRYRICSKCAERRRLSPLGGAADLSPPTIKG